MNDSLPKQNHGSRKRLAWLFGPAIAAACAVALLLAAFLNSPLPAAWVMIAAVGMVLCQFARVSTAGIVLGCVAAVAMSVSIRVDANGIKELCGTLGGLLLLASSIVLLVAAAKDRERRAGNCGGCDLAFFTLIIFGTAGQTVRNCLRQHEDVQRTKQTLITFHQLHHLSRANGPR